jgi:DNA-binding NtrC family response regulator
MAWLVKPADPQVVVSTVRRLIERRKLQQRTGILGEAPPIQEVLVKIEQMAPVSSTVLIEGESGTGKELVAKAIHDLSPRRGKPFIAVNTAGLPETLLESELFGHEKGAFTGAAERRLGRFELANGGTILLDEVGEMPPPTQVKLLRVLEDRSFFRVGGTQPITVDVRVIAATNQSLKEAVGMGRFRDDLFYRLNVPSVYLPPLRGGAATAARPHIHRRVRQDATASSRASRPRRYGRGRWPGNGASSRTSSSRWSFRAAGNSRERHPVRRPRAHDIAGADSCCGARGRRVSSRESGLEFIFRTLVELKMQLEALRHRIEERPSERVEIIEVGPGSREGGRGTAGGGGQIEASTIDPLQSSPEPNGDKVIYKPGMTMSDVERAAIDAALRETRGNRRKAAETLGIGERTLYRKLKEYAID